MTTSPKDLANLILAFDRGDKVQFKYTEDDEWKPQLDSYWDASYIYRIAPKKEMTLVEELRALNSTEVGDWFDITNRAANRIEELEGRFKSYIEGFSNNELLNEVARRLV